MSSTREMAADAAPPRRYPPLEQFFGPPGTLATRPARLTRARAALLWRRDPVLLLAIAIAIPVVVMEAMTGTREPLVSVIASLAFVAVQVTLARAGPRDQRLQAVRLALALAFVTYVNAVLATPGTWPLNALQIPTIALAAALGGPARVVAGIGILATAIPAVLPGVPDDLRNRAVAVTMASLVTAIGAHQTVRALEHAAMRLRRTNARDRRLVRQLAAMEAVGRVLAREGSTTLALGRVVEVIEEAFGYRYPSVYLWDGSMLRLGAQRNYQTPVLEVAPDRGVVGRVVRSRVAELVSDASFDADFVSGDPNAASEIAVPLLSGDELLGVLNVETDRAHRLGPDDLATMLIVGDRLAAALALGRERQKLTERVALLARLASFEASLSTSLDPAVIRQHVATGAALVVPADMLVLVLGSGAPAEFRVSAIAGGDPTILGARILPGEGVTGRALGSRSLVVDDHLERASFPRSTARARVADVVAAMSAPLVHGDQVVGAITWLRDDVARAFTPQEQEAAGLLSNRVTLAVLNATLHEEAREAAITDPLSGLHNRRHFDAAMAQGDALRARFAPGDRRERSAIMFDLDHFGAINKRHGHQVGDEILRSFADVLRSRVRASDLVARYGGEEFVVILDGASREEAVRLADQVRIAFRQRTIDASTAENGLPITTVSAGCAASDPSETSGVVLLERADVGLAMAKAGGRDQVVAA